MIVTQEPNHRLYQRSHPWPCHNHIPLFLFTGQERESKREKNTQRLAILIPVPSYWNQILIFFSFLNRKSALFKWNRFLLGFGRRGAEMSILWNIVSCGFGTRAGNWIQQMCSCIWCESFWPEKGKYACLWRRGFILVLSIMFSLNSLDFFVRLSTVLVKNDEVNDRTL